MRNIQLKICAQIIGIIKRIIKEFLDVLIKILTVLLIAMTPVMELRAAIPVGVASGLDLKLSILISIIGNIIPVPFIVLFIEKIFQWMKRYDFFKRIVEKMENKVDKKRDVVDKYGYWGLFLFVAIPLPGTGAWTGSLVAALLKMKIKKSFIA